MDRRTTLAKLFGQKLTESAIGLTTLFSGLDEYTGVWGYEQAAHLLRRASFGPTHSDIKQAVSDGLEATLNRLLENKPLPDPPINYYFEDDPNVPIGETWINAPLSADVNLAQPRYRSLFGWTIGQILEEGVHSREKMTLFLYNHFGMANVNDARFRYRSQNLMRTYALGNFKELVREMTIDPGMLRFLNGNQNTKNAPNENYARELLELFTLGKGDLIASGDYSTYTEDDVIAIAKVLTGWRDRGFNSTNPDVEIEAVFIPNRHNTDTKQLSYHFGNVEIPDMGENEYSYLIDIIFTRIEVARFIVRKLYRWFVYYEISDDAEENVIEPLADYFIENNYEIMPVLRKLFSSEHFFDILNIGPMIKNPMDFTVSVLKLSGVDYESLSLLQKYNAWRTIYFLPASMEMEYYAPPSVAGWKAYYQEPGYYRIWINSTTLQARMTFSDQWAGNGYNISGYRHKVNAFYLLENIDNPYDVNDLISEFVQMLLPQPITDDQHAVLKDIVLPGLPDYEWAVEYSDYESDPTNSDLRTSIETKILNLTKAMMAMAEFYLM